MGRTIWFSNRNFRFSHLNEKYANSRIPASMILLNCLNTLVLVLVGFEPTTCRLADRRTLIKSVTGHFDRFHAQTILEVNEIFVSFHCLNSYQNDLFRNDFLTKRPVSIKITISALIFYLLFYQYSALKVAHTGQSVEEAVENVVVAVSEIARIVPRGWNNIQSLNLKTTDSISLPIYTSLPEKSLALETSEPPKKKKKKAWPSIFSSSFYILYL